MTDKAIKCAEEIENKYGDFLLGDYTNVEDDRIASVAAIIRKHYSSSWVKVVEGKPETYPPIYREVLVSFNCGPQRFVRADAWDGMRWERSLADVLYWRFHPTPPEDND